MQIKMNHVKQYSVELKSENSDVVNFNMADKKTAADCKLNWDEKDVRITYPQTN